MKRAIIPVNIESMGIKISNQNELFELYKTNREIYNYLRKSGDSQRISFSYSRELPCLNADEESKMCDTEKYLEPNSDPFKYTGEDTRFILHGLEYMVKQTESLNNIYIMGMHRHRTLLNCLSNHIKIQSNVTLGYMLIRDALFHVQNGETLRIESAMLDNTRVRVDKGGILELIDIEFSNVKTECIHLAQGSIVNEYTNVSYFDVHKHFYIEYATKINHSKIINFSSPRDIIDFFETSLVPNIELVDNLMIPNGLIRLKQPINFINESDKEIKVLFKKIEVSSNIFFSGAIVVVAHVDVVDSYNVELSLANFEGSLTIEESRQVLIKNTRFDRFGNEKIFEIYSSTVWLEDVSVTNSDKAIRMANSEVTFSKNLHAINTSQVCYTQKGEQKDDSTLVAQELMENKIVIANSKMEATNFIDSCDVSQFSMFNTDILGSNMPIKLTGCGSATLNKIQALNNNVVGSFTSSRVRADNCAFSNGRSLFVVDGSDIELTNSSVADFEIGVDINSGVFTARHVFFNSNGFGVVGQKEDSVFKHYECSFKGSKERNIHMKYGSTIIDLKEEEELELCLKG